MKDLTLELIKNGGYSLDRCSSYEDIVDLFGKVIKMKSIGDYQGDYLTFLEKDGKYGFLTFGYGSCSGCDALQACCNNEELADLIKGLHDSIKWFDGKQEALTFLDAYDWKGQWYGNEDTKAFIDDVKKHLNT